MKRNLMLVNLLLAAAAAVHARDGFPAFTWDHVPLYAHLACTSGYGMASILSCLIGLV